ncbi:MAG: SpoIIE family protein phosphatase [Pirellulales bacterium]|nr:SpoIIE family protein phosphatase [Pirellulales bacterium]
MAILFAVQGLAPGTQFPIVEDRAILGRHPDCQIVLDEAAVSRHHAEITCQGDCFFIQDLGSRNGTFVNGRLIDGRVPLRNGDRILICDLAFEFQLTSPSELLLNQLNSEDAPTTFLLDDDEVQDVRSKIMSKLEVSTDYGSIRLSAKPEIKLAALIEITQSLSRTVSVQDILPRILDSLFKVFVQADRAFVIMNDMERQRLVPAAMRHRRESDEERVRISQTIVREALEHKEAVLSADATSDQRFSMAESIADFRIRSLMCAPMINSEGEPLGVIQVDTVNQRNRFDENDLEVLASVALQAGMALDNAKMHERVFQQRALARDLELAHRVQRGLVPTNPPQVTGYHFFHFYNPAYQVGGDYYDYVPLPGGRHAVIVADVAGKGVSAALLMAKLSGEVRFYLATRNNPADACREINRMFARPDWEDRFVTMIMAVLDPIKHQLTLVNAGHMAPMLRHSGGRVEAIGQDQAGLPLGVLEEYDYECYVRNVEPGDFLTIFTDGISEAMNPDKQLYGLERLAIQIGSQAASVSDLGLQILEDVRAFVGSQPQSDDMCLACFGRENGS